MAKASQSGPEELGWGSPVPAEYGSLQAMPPPPVPAQAAPAPLLRRLHSNGSAAWADQPTEAVPVAPPEEPPAQSEAAQPEAAQPESRLPPADAGPEPAIVRRTRRRAGRTRAAVRHVDIKSVIKVSVVFYLVVLVVMVVASVLLWATADAFGTLPSIDKSIRTLFSLKSYTLHPGAVALYAGAAGGVIAVAGTLWNILLAVIYNLIADSVGGMRVDLESFGPE